MAATFEECCADLTWQLADEGALPFVPQRVGHWWRRDEEIDILALNEETREVLFGECKWSQQPVGIDVLHSLYR